jgi:NAD-dependent dihydropyrimidine dehydrogenase PreA subunit
MADKSPTWHGIPRQEIPWYPTINAETCIGCELCYVTCGRNVFEMRDRKSIVAHPFQCMVGCSTCAAVW